MTPQGGGNVFGRVKLCQRESIADIHEAKETEMLLSKSITTHVLRQKKLKLRMLGVEHSVFEPATRNRAVIKMYHSI